MSFVNEGRCDGIGKVECWGVKGLFFFMLDLKEFLGM